jgi:hypothetical protein
MGFDLVAQARRLHELLQASARHRENSKLDTDSWMLYEIVASRHGGTIENI